MPILVNDLVAAASANLLSEGFDYFTFDKDFQPAINSGIGYFVSLINSIEGGEKFTGELFRELSYTRVFRASNESRISFNQADLGHEVWGILAIMPVATTKIMQAPVITYNPAFSYYLSNERFLSSDFSTKRLNSEEWITNKFNPMMPGNVIQNLAVTELTEYAHLESTNFSALLSDTPQQVINMIEVRPTVALGRVGATYISVPVKVLTINDSVAFPMSAFQLILTCMMRSLSYKMGDNTTVYEVATSDLKALLGALN